MRKVFAIIVILVFYGCNSLFTAKDRDELNSNIKIENNIGNFQYINYAPLSNRPIEVYYYKPQTLRKNSKVLILMHGNSRAAESYRESMIPFAEKYNFLLIVPKFSVELYPPLDYHQGGVFNKEGVIKPKEDWTFSVIEPLFDYVKQRFSLNTDSYILYGFSAGSQFVHRFTWFVPENRADITIAASAGSYTLPDYDTSYFYGLENTNIPIENIKKAFKKEYTLMVGSADTILSRSDLPKSEFANRQGRDRVERANRFYNTAKKLAEDNDWFFNWDFLTIDDVGHNQKEIAEPVIEFLFNSK